MMHMATAPFILALPFILFGMIYLACVPIASKKFGHWPASRTFCCISGCGLAFISVFGPLASLAHHHFVWHMAGHLLLGMLSPLLIALSAPVTLLLRTLPAKKARQCTRFLRSRIGKIYTHPITAATLNMGGLWLLYTTDLFKLMHEHTWIYILIHIHIFAAGYLFTVSMVYIDPIPYRVPYQYRGTILLLTLAAHGILAKYMYGYPPAGVPAVDAQAGSLLMYYGGDLIDACIIYLLIKSWHQSLRRNYEKRTILEKSV